jgi:hypothetical protein
MRYRWIIFAALIAVALSGSVAFGDQIILKSGREYSGKFVRGDSNVVEFRILGRVESFKTEEVAQIVFKEPDLVTPPSGRTVTSTPEAVAPARPAQPERALTNQDGRFQTSGRQATSDPSTGATVTLPAGTSLTIRMSETVDTDRNRVGDSFLATLEEPLMLGSQVIIPRGAEVRGAIAYAKESGRVAGQSELILELTELRYNGRSYTLQTSDYSEVGASRGKRTATAAGGTAALGAIIGAIAGGGKGAAIGAASGAAVGTGVAVMTKGQTLKVPVETVLDFKLQKSLTVDAP